MTADAQPKRGERLRELTARLDRAGYTAPPERMLLLEAAQLFSRLDAAPHEFSVTSVVSTRTGEGLIDVTWHGTPAQITAIKAREIAWMLLEGAAVAEAESMLIRFLKSAVHLSDPAASMMLLDFRRFREAEQSSLLTAAKDTQ